MTRKENKQQSIQVLVVLKWFAKFAINIIIYHLIVRLVFDYKILYVKVETYEKFERSVENFKRIFWWVDFDS